MTQKKRTANGADEVKSGLAAFIFFGQEKAQTENGYKTFGPAGAYG
jgi:hypothetical protein